MGRAKIITVRVDDILIHELLKTVSHDRVRMSLFDIPLLWNSGIEWIIVDMPRWRK